TLDEFGNGSANTPLGTIPLPGTVVPTVLQQDALVYPLVGPPPVAGVVRLTEFGEVAASHVLLFLGSGVAFLSELPEPGEVPVPPADTGIPFDILGELILFNNLPNVLIDEVGMEGGLNGARYQPTDGQPGFIPGFDTTYVIISDGMANPIPEP